jgi:hypothetical protein
MNKRGQLNLSFGMIFSIILIILFLVFGFYAIKKFIEFQNDVQIKQFSADLQNDVDTLWKSTQGSQNIKYSLPTKITSVCFTSRDEFQNMKFTSSSIIQGEEINNIDILKMTETEEPFCITNAKGKISITLTKNFGESLVTIAR